MFTNWDVHYLQCLHLKCLQAYIKGITRIVITKMFAMFTNQHMSSSPKIFYPLKIFCIRNVLVMFVIRTVAYQNFLCSKFLPSEMLSTRNVCYPKCLLSKMFATQIFTTELFATYIPIHHLECSSSGGFLTATFHSLYIHTYVRRKFRLLWSLRWKQPCTVW